MFLKTFDEMLQDYALKIEKAGEEFQAECITFIPELGMCSVFIMPVVWVEDKKIDCVVRFLPFGGEDSWYCLDSNLPPEFKN